MPDISKINALAIGSVGKVDGLAKASILDINGVAVPAGVAPPLDTYTGAAAAYSVRLLRTAYTGDIMRVRRASDNVEADVGFDGSNELSLTSPISNTSDAQSYTDFADFVDHTGTPTSAFVRYWYDQASTNDAGQSTAGEQPQLYDATTGLITDNGKPCVKFTRTNSTNLLTPSTSWSTAGAMQFFMVFNNEGQVGNQETWSNASNRMFTGAGLYMIETAAGNLFYTSSKVQDQNLFVYEHNSTARTVYIDGSQDVTSASPSNVSTSSSIGALGRRYNFAEGYTDVLWQELIHYPTDQSSNRTNIETNINGFFSVYP